MRRPDDVELYRVESAAVPAGACGRVEMKPTSRMSLALLREIVACAEVGVPEGFVCFPGREVYYWRRCEPEQ